MRHRDTPGMLGFIKRPMGVVVAFATMVSLMFGVAAFAAQDGQPSIGAQDAKKGAQEKPQVEKSETVYGMLNADGTVRDTYVVNRFVADTPCKAEDYGAYTMVANLSSTKPLVSKNGKVSFEIEGDPFFYQGTMGIAELPWTISLAYRLDGNAVTADKLAGSAGKLEIELRTSANPKVNSAFYDSFVLQATITLDGDRCSDINAKGATLAASGKDQTIAFTVLPGHDGSFKLSAQVKDFEMPSVQIAALPYSSVVEMPDTSEMEDGLESLSSAVSQINQGTSELANGAAELSSGADSLASGAKEFGDGLASLSSSSTQIVKASSEIEDGLSQVAEALKGLDLSSVDDLAKYAPVLQDIAEGLDALKVTAQAVDDGYAQIGAILDYLASVVRDNPLSDEEIAALRAAVADDEKDAAALEKLLAAYAAAQSAVDEYYAGGGSPEKIAEQLEEFFKDGGELDRAIDGLNTASEFLENGGVDQLKQLVKGLTDMADGYSEFHAGLVEYTEGVKQLNDNYGDLSSGMSQLADGTSQFSDGANQLSSGISELNDETSDLPAQMRDRMGELMADYDFPEFEPVSFVDERNKNVTAVQFVLLTDAIEKPEAEAEEPEPEPEPTMWERFLALLGL